MVNLRTVILSKNWLKLTNSDIMVKLLLINIFWRPYKDVWKTKIKEEEPNAKFCSNTFRKLVQQTKTISKWSWNLYFSFWNVEPLEKVWSISIKCKIKKIQKAKNKTKNNKVTNQISIDNSNLRFKVNIPIFINRCTLFHLIIRVSKTAFNINQNWFQRV